MKIRSDDRISVPLVTDQNGTPYVSIPNIVKVIKTLKNAVINLTDDDKDVELVTQIYDAIAEYFENFHIEETKK